MLATQRLAFGRGWELSFDRLAHTTYQFHSQPSKQPGPDRGAKSPNKSVSNSKISSRSTDGVKKLQRKGQNDDLSVSVLDLSLRARPSLSLSLFLRLHLNSTRSSIWHVYAEHYVILISLALYVYRLLYPVALKVLVWGWVLRLYSATM